MWHRKANKTRSLASIVLAGLILLGGLFVAPQAARAACASPSGAAGDILYNSAQSVMQYCNNTNWIATGTGPKSGGGCTSPSGGSGQMLYNADYKVPQYCNGYEWVGMGKNALPYSGVAGGWMQMDAGLYFACGIKKDGRLYCWGINNYDQLGNPGNNAWDPVEVTGGGSWKQVSAGSIHTCAIKTDDTLWCWGDGANGKLGNGSTSGQSSPVAVSVTGSIPDTWKSVSAGGTHTCAIGTDDTLWCWGDGTDGRRGDNATTGTQSTAVQVNGGGTWKSVEAGGTSTCGIKSDDTAWCWGLGSDGQRGDGSTTATRSTPAAVVVTGSIPDTWKKISLSLDTHGCGIGIDDTLWCWGSNASGQLGDTTLISRSSPTAVSGGGTWLAVTAGSSAHTCAIASDKSVECWGNNFHGQTGGEYGNNAPNGAVGNGDLWTQITAADSMTCGIRVDDSMSCWGYPVYGELGQGQISVDPAMVPGAWKFVAIGFKHTCAIKSDDTIWCWGPNTYGELGNGTNTFSTQPVVISGGGTWKMVAAGSSHSCGIKSNDTAWCWGVGSSGQLGDGTATDSTAPVAVAGGATWKKIATGDRVSCGIKSNDTIWCWGNDYSGELGDGTGGVGYSVVPVAISGGGTWKQVATNSGNHVCAIKSDDTLWCWGGNAYGQLGDNSNTTREVPTAISGGGTWKALAIGDIQTCAVKSDDTFWCWGAGGTGQLGDGLATDSLVPVTVSGGGTWKSGDSGWQHTCAIKSDNSLSCWGHNGAQQLGDGTEADRAVPTAVFSGTTWTQVAGGDWHTCGIRTDTSLWCWGMQHQLNPTPSKYCTSPSGQAGDFVYNNASSVLQFCNGSGWVSIGK